MSHAEFSVNIEWHLTQAVVFDDLAEVEGLVISHGLPFGGGGLLLDAVKLSRTKIVKYLLQKGAKVDSVDSNGDTPLHIAVANGDLEIVQMLFETSRVDVSEGYMLLLDAVKLGHTEIIKYLVESGVKVNSRDSITDSPLHFAVSKGNLRLVQILLGSNAVVDNAEGYALLSDAIKLGHSSIVKFLLEKGVKVNSVEANADTPLHVAVANGEVALVRTLLENNAIVNALNVEKETPLHVAVEKGDEDIVCLLLQEGARSLPDKSNFEPLHLACFKQSANIVELLLVARARLEFADPRSLTVALLIAAQSGNEQIVSLLLNGGANPNGFLKSPLSHHRLSYSVIDGSFPIHVACEGGYFNVVKLLLEHRRELTNCVQSPNNSMYKNTHLEAVCYLSDAQADLNVKATGNLTPLHLAARGGHLRVVDLLCKNGAIVEALTEEHLTPILLAAKNGHEDAVKMLLYRGANVNATDEEENSLLHFALETKSSFLTSCILQFEPNIDEKIYHSICNFFNYEHNSAFDDLIVYCIADKKKDVRKFSLFSAVRKGYSKAVKILLAHGFIPNPESGLLHLAVRNGHYSIIQSLLKSGCGVNSETLNGKTPIHYLFCSGQRSNYYAIFQLLLSNGADFKKAPTLLLDAVDNECIEVCTFLIRNGVDVNMRGGLHETPLHHTVPYPRIKKINEEKRGKIARILLENGANIHAQDHHHSTTLDRAVENKCLDVILVLLEFQRYLLAWSVGVKTPLYYAIQFERNNAVEELRKNRAEVGDFERRDAVMMLCDAASKGQEELVTLLLQFDVNVNAQDGVGQTALHKAMKGRHHKIVAALLENDCDINIEDRLGKTALGISESHSVEREHPLRRLIVRHVLKMKAARLFISGKNHRLLREVWLTASDEHQEFEQECKKEVKRMKRLKLCCHLKLHDVLVNPRNFAFVASESLLHAFESVDLSQFPIYQSLIEKRSKKNIQINASKKWLRVLIKTHEVLHQVDTPNLPVELWLKIVSYFDHNDARCLIECGEALKRKLCQ